MAAPTEGLRERKKRATREAIAATARRLFAERGFDAVTVAEVAAAADVSEKTVFNHFADEGGPRLRRRRGGLAQLVAAIAERPPGTSVLDVFRATDRGDARRLRRRRGRGPPRRGQDRPRQPRAAGAPDRRGGSAGPRPSPPRSPRRPARPTTTSCPASSPARCGGRTARSSSPRFDGLLAGEDREQLAARLRVAADRAYDQLAAGLGEYGKGYASITAQRGRRRRTRRPRAAAGDAPGAPGEQRVDPPARREDDQDGPGLLGLERQGGEDGRARSRTLNSAVVGVADERARGRGPRRVRTRAPRRSSSRCGYRSSSRPPTRPPRP